MTLRTPLLGATLLALSVSFAPVASAEEFGTIKGRLVWGGKALPDATPKVRAGDANAKDAAVCAVKDVPNEDFVVDPATKGVANGFAYLVTPKGTNPEAEKALVAKAATVEVDQKNCRFLPHAVAFHKDQTLVFKASDAVGHNVKYTAFVNGGDNKMMAPGGTMEKKFPVAERNPTQFECNIHPWMKGWFMVFDHPFFALTGTDGSFEIKGVPAGVQKVIVRQETVGFVTKGGRTGVEVEVKPGAVTDLGEIVLMPKN